MLGVVDFINKLPSADIKQGNFVMIRGRPCQVRKIHHVIFSTPVSAKFGNKTVEIKGTDMITREECNWVGYAHNTLDIFFPMDDKMLFITLTEKSILALTAKNKMISIPFPKTHPFRIKFAGDKWTGELNILKVPIRNGKIYDETLCLDSVISWI